MGNITAHAAYIDLNSNSNWYIKANEEKTIEIRFTASEPNVSWTIESYYDISWLTFSQTSGTTNQSGQGSFTVFVPANPDPVERSVSISVEIEESLIGAGFSIHQEGYRYITLEPTKWDPLLSETTKDVAVSSNVDWNVNKKDASLTWLTVTKQNGSLLRIQVEPNTTPFSRSGTFTVSHLSYVSHNFTVNQVPALTLSQGTDRANSNKDGTISWQPRSTGGSMNLNIDVNTGSRTEPWTAESKSDWMTLAWPDGTPSTKIDGTGDVTLILAAASNITTSERSGEIWVTVAGITHKVIVQQDMLYLRLNENQWDASIYSGTKEIGIESNTSWKAASDSPWLRIALPGGTPAETANGANNSQLTLYIPDNTFGTDREGTITFTIEDGSVLATFKVYQRENNSYEKALSINLNEPHSVDIIN